MSLRKTGRRFVNRLPWPAKQIIVWLWSVHRLILYRYNRYRYHELHATLAKFTAAQPHAWMYHQESCPTRNFGSGLGPCNCGAMENPAISVVLEHLMVYHALYYTLTAEKKRLMAQRVVESVLALNGAKVIR